MVLEELLREALVGGCGPEPVKGRSKWWEVLPQEEHVEVEGVPEHTDNVLSSKGGGVDNTLLHLAHEHHSNLHS